MEMETITVAELYELERLCKKMERINEEQHTMLLNYPFSDIAQAASNLHHYDFPS